ncbi:hypothetical protein GCM10010271_68520 [Streptomyces kurssanovii]|nr:hypothetical protein GCM10010271_68520 [Streptomyces kurssanovii]
MRSPTPSAGSGSSSAKPSTGPPAPDWLLEMGIGTKRLPVYVHVGNCHMVGKRARGVSQDIAVRALTEGRGAFTLRPETLLGVLD